MENFITRLIGFLKRNIAWLPIILLTIFFATYYFSTRQSVKNTPLPEALKRKAVIRGIEAWAEEYRERESGSFEVTPELFNITVSDELNERFNINYLWEISSVNVNVITDSKAFVKLAEKLKEDTA